jgi:hypothetical protein
MRLPRRLTVPGAMAISAVVATLFVFWSLATISVAPPGVKARHLGIGAAATHVMIDAPTSLLVEQDKIDVLLSTFTKRAELYGNMIPTPPVLELLQQHTGIAPDQVNAITRLTEGVQLAMREPGAEQQATRLLEMKRPYRLDIQANPSHAVLNVYAQAPTPAEAVKLADGTVAALNEYVAQRAEAAGVPPEQRVRLVQLGHARGAAIEQQTRPTMAALSFVIVFALTMALLFSLRAVRRGWIAAGSARGGFAAPALPGFGTPPATAATARRTGRKLGDWPHTTRVMPWMIAAFMVILWLVPFNVIQLGVSLPFDAKLDRLVLPALFLVWILSLAIGGPESPRMRMTLIHVGIFGFMAIVGLGVLVNAHALNHQLEFELAVKKITLLLSYVIFFVIVASSVRRSEIPSFLRYMLWLSVICAIGVVWEYRFEYNAFYDIAQKLLGTVFEVAPPAGGTIDDMGRHLTRGPADHPLEAVGMMTMALPVALVGVISSPERRKRILYTLAACVLLAAAMSTYRKSALLAPISVCLTIAYFRRGDLLKLAPLGVLALGAIHTLSPGALGAIVFQLKPSSLGVSTVSDRASDYDAVRPDVWSHLLLGRGYGTYDHNAYRVLDSEVLGRLVDTGVLGLLALFAMLLFIVFAARATIRSKHPVWSPPALAIAAAAVAFLVLAFLFDITSFPHDPYILMTLAGFLAVLVSADEADDGGGRDEVVRRPDPLPEPRPPHDADDLARIPVMEVI